MKTGKDTTMAERISAHRTLPASPQAIFDVLADPDGGSGEVGGTGAGDTAAHPDNRCGWAPEA